MYLAPLRFSVGIILLCFGLASLFGAQDNNEGSDKPDAVEQVEGAQPDTQTTKADKGEEVEASDETDEDAPKEPDALSPVEALDANATDDDSNGSKGGAPTTETGEPPAEVKPSKTADGNKSDAEAPEVETVKPVGVPGADEGEGADNNVTLVKEDGNSTTPLDKQSGDDSFKFWWLGLTLAVVIYLFVRNRVFAKSESDESPEPGEEETEETAASAENEEAEEPGEPEEAPPLEPIAERYELSGVVATAIASALNELSDRQSRESAELKSSISDVMEGFTILQKALDEKDQEIRRLRKGFDTEVFRRFLKRFIRVDDALADEIAEFPEGDAKSRNSLVEVREILQDAFYECGLEDFTPKVGEKVKDAFGIEDNPKTIPPETPEQELSIAEIREPGYLLRTPGDPECVKPAKVIVYGKMEE